MASIAVSTLVVPYFKVVAVTIPANTALPEDPCIVAPTPTFKVVAAVTIPANTALPEPSIVAPIPGPKEPPPALKQVPAVIIPEVTSIPVELIVTPEPILACPVKVETPVTFKVVVVEHFIC